MIIYKTPQEVEMIRKSSRILSAVLTQVMAHVKPGVSAFELDAMAEMLIRQAGGKPSFKYYRSDDSDPPFPTSLCSSVNYEVVHAPSTKEKILSEGDIIGLDLGVNYQGYFSDMAVTVGVGHISEEAQKLLEVTYVSLRKAIAQIKPGNLISDISKAIQNYAEGNGFSVVRELVGHGVGKAVHEDPRIPNFYTESAEHIELKEGMVIAVEPMINVGTYNIEVLKDGWTVVTKDRKLSAHFEHTIAVTAEGCEVLTAFEDEKYNV